MKKKRVILFPYGDEIRLQFRKMKLTAILLFIVCVTFGNSFSQVKLTVRFEKTDIRDVMQTIEEKTNYIFLYKDEIFDFSQKVTADFTEAKFEDVLKTFCDQTNVAYEVRDRQIILKERAAIALEELPQQQTKELSGIISDIKGIPLPGVSVVIKGTTIATITDLNGKYSLSNVPSEATLRFSFIGMNAQEFLVGEQTSINVVLEEQTIGISEIVAVGYGTRKKESLTGAITQIKGSEILTTKSTNLVSSLQGKVSGLQIRQQTGEPGKFTSMMSIRGFGTPLIVIDGVARDGVSDFERLNQEDIESISVLKDASAAIYGINADNGVIIVTTKKGAKGDAQVSYSGYFGLTSPTILQKTVDAYTSMLLRNEIDVNSGSPKTFSDPVLLEKYRLGTEEGYQDYNWVDNMLKSTTSQQQHNLSIKGGSDKVNYYTSLGFVVNNGILESDIEKYQKFNFRTNLSVNVSKDLVASINFAGRVDKNKGPQGSFFWLLKPIMSADRRFGPTTIGNPNHVTLIPAIAGNPYALMTESISGYDKWEENQYQTSIDLTYTAPFMKGLKFKVLGAYDTNVRNASNLLKTYNQYDYYTDSPTTPTAKPTYWNDNTLFSRKDFQAQILYDNTLGEAHYLGATLVYEAKSTNQNYLRGQRQWDELYTNDILDQADLTNLSNAGYRTETAFMSLLGRFNYAYKSKYLVEFAFREDGSYRYAPTSRWGFFPSISGGWRISEESFIKDNLSFISNLKLRGSYGQIGADPENSPPFQYVGGYSTGTIDQGYVFNNGVLTKAMIPQGVINDNLTWIKTKTADVGIDLDFWNGKLGITADLFQKDRTGLLGYRNVSVPNMFGGTFPQENLNSDRVKGYDFLISHRNKIGKFSYGVSANLTYARTQKVYTERKPYGSSWEKWHDMNADGRIQGAYWGFNYDGVYTDLEQYQTAPLVNGYWSPEAGNSRNLPGSLKITDSNGDGTINSSDMVPNLWTGRNNPPLQYGLSLNAAWKGIDFNALLQGAALFTVTYANSDMWGYGTHAQITDKFLDRWHAEDPDADPFDPATVWIPGYYPALKLGPKAGTNDELDTDQSEMNATYLRIKSLEVGYTLTKQLSKMLHVDNIRVYVNAYNLVTFANKQVKMFDPERFEGEYNADLTYPLMKSYNFGLNINF
jgi:TonB-linked SusC/RagA family outer membrane protein